MSDKRGKFKFINYSGTHMLRLETAEDLQALPLLDEPFWMATSAPVHHLRCDAKFLSFLDKDNDGRILSGDVRRAHAWMCARLADLTDVTQGSDLLDLGKLAGSPEAEPLRMAARRILRNLGRQESNAIRLADVRNHQAYRTKGIRNGDGIIPPTAIETDAELQAFAVDVVATMGGSPDLTGEKGVAEADLDAFLKASHELLTWRARSQGETAGDLFPLGEATAAAWQHLRELRVVIDHYFRLCRMVVLDQMLARVTPVPPSSVSIMDDDAAIDSSLAEAPIALPNTEERLLLQAQINPTYRERLATLVSQVFRPLLGASWDGEALSADAWQRIKATFTLYEGWLNAKPGGEVEKLGPEKLQAYVEGPLPEKLRALIKKDQAIGRELSVVQDLEHLILMQRGFLELARNFVSFHNLYDPTQRALFEVGRMIIGGRVFNLNMQVRDVNAHSKLAQESGILLLYSEVTSATQAETFYVVTPVTTMTLGRLGMERRGVLFDLQGRQWDARVIKIIDNPISLWDAIRKPFLRVADAIGGAFNRIVSGTETQLETSLNQQFTEVEKTVKGTVAESSTATAAPAPVAAPVAPVAPTATAATPAAPAPAAKTSNARDWMLSGSFAIAALSSSFAFVTSKLATLTWEEQGRQILIIILVGLALIIIPTILIAFFKLRKRNLGSLLEASGWAINAEMRVTRRLAKVLAPCLRHPAGFILGRTDRTRFFARRAKDCDSTACRTGSEEK